MSEISKNRKRGAYGKIKQQTETVKKLKCYLQKTKRRENNSESEQLHSHKAYNEKTTCRTKQVNM